MMSISMESSGKAGSQDFDLNLAPIIDCLTVLIAFMLASTAFLSIGILDAGVAAAGAVPASSTPPAVTLSVELGKDKDLIVRISGKATSTTPIAHQGEDWNLPELSRKLASLKTQWPDLSVITLSAADRVKYEDVVKTMEVDPQDDAGRPAGRILR